MKGMIILNFTWSFSTVYDWLVIHHDAIESVSFIAVIISAILVFIKIRLFLKDYINKNKRAEYEKSYAMAKFYAENLLPRMAPIRILLNKINIKVIKDYQDSFEDNISKMHAFNIGEARTIFEDTQIKQYRKSFIAFLEPNEMISFFANFEHKTAVEIKSEWNNILKGKSKIDRQSFYSEKRTMLMRHIADFFNDLEYFSMVFCSGLAVPDNVYASLHQTYNMFVQQGYLYIATRNKADGHDYFTHIIRLYNNWYRKSVRTDLKYFLDTLKLVIRAILKIYIKNIINKIKQKNKTSNR